MAVRLSLDINSNVQLHHILVVQHVLSADHLSLEGGLAPDARRFQDYAII
jgi:hypothetical protein